MTNFIGAELSVSVQSREDAELEQKLNDMMQGKVIESVSLCRRELVITLEDGQTFRILSDERFSEAVSTH